MKTTEIQDFVLPISQRLQSVMEAKGWTPDELAHKSRLHPDTVRRVLNGNIYSLHALARVSNALGAADPYELPLVHPVIPPAGDGVPHPFGYPDYAMLAQLNTTPSKTFDIQQLRAEQQAHEAAAQTKAWMADQQPTDQGTDLTPDLDRRLAELKKVNATHATGHRDGTTQGDGLIDQLGSLQLEVARLNRVVAGLKLELDDHDEKIAQLVIDVDAHHKQIAKLLVDVGMMNAEDRHTVQQAVEGHLATTRLFQMVTHVEVAEAIAEAVTKLREETNGFIKAIDTDVGRLKGLVHLCQSVDIEHSDDIEALKSRMGMMSS
jgi:transcriptional regulator with XRE-family HTH domain